MINLFIDSQIWLDLYYFSSNDLVQFEKLNDMLGVDVNIIFTRQVKNEVDRNREIKIKEAMKQFKEYKLQFPNLCKGYKEYNDLCTLFKKSCVV